MRRRDNHVDDVSVHTCTYIHKYIHTYIHRYSDFCYNVTFVFEARSGSEAHSGSPQIIAWIDVSEDTLVVLFGIHFVV